MTGPDLVIRWSTAGAVNGRPLRLGSRRSPMAIAQSRQVAGMITERTGRPGWRGHGGGGSARARVPPRRSASRGRYRPAGHVPGQVGRVACGRPGDPRTTGTAWVAAPNRDLAGDRDAGVGVSPGLLARALTGMPAISRTRRREHRRHRRRVPTGRFRRKREEQRGRSIAGSPHAAGVMLMPDSRQPDDGAGTSTTSACASTSPMRMCAAGSAQPPGRSPGQRYRGQPSWVASSLRPGRRGGATFTAWR
jgi:hypothetical protein